MSASKRPSRNSSTGSPSLQCCAPCAPTPTRGAASSANRRRKNWTRNWRRSGAGVRRNVLAPSLASPCSGGKLDWFLHPLAQPRHGGRFPAFYVHTGCEGISPPGWRNRPFQDAGYGVRQGGEALLFFGDGLALVGRAKVFYDEPRGFAAALGRGGTVGEAWREYFRLEAQEPGKGVGDIGRKRAYFWSLLGDPTLRLLPPRERDSGK
ncbi:MAG: hypothetical protein R3E96_05560 [Planctomycetota bacterium]